jgi:hypothetical protein
LGPNFLINIYIHLHIKNIRDSIIYASFHRHEKHAKPFRLSYYNDYHFVGEIILEDKSRCKEHIYLLKNSIKK